MSLDFTSSSPCMEQSSELWQGLSSHHHYTPMNYYLIITINITMTVHSTPGWCVMSQLLDISDTTDWIISSYLFSLYILRIFPTINGLALYNTPQLYWSEPINWQWWWLNWLSSSGWWRGCFDAELSEIKSGLFLPHCQLFHQTQLDFMTSRTAVFLTDYLNM